MDPLAGKLTLAEITLRFVIASIAGGILGVPSQIRRNTAGIRTHALVSMGAVLFCISGIAIVGKGSPELLRVIQGITSAVGFIATPAVGIIGALIASSINLGLMVLEARVLHPTDEEDPPGEPDASV